MKTPCSTWQQQNPVSVSDTSQQMRRRDSTGCRVRCGGRAIPCSSLRSRAPASPRMTPASSARRPANTGASEQWSGGQGGR
eukprot:3007175-Rhodomonas_salina.2